MTTPILDYVPRLVEANKDHRVTAIDSGTAVWWAPGAQLDQGQEGACVGFGTTAEYGATPVRGKINNPLAFSVYNRAKEIDEFEGVDYEGTSVRAGMLVGREKGWWTGFKWTFNMDELRQAIRLGPVVIGIEWREGMYEARNGLVSVTGPVVGGHCILLTGWSPNYNRRGPVYRWKNSWGTSYGINGSAYIKEADLKSVLFDTGGEAAVPVGRKLA